MARLKADIEEPLRIARVPGLVLAVAREGQPVEQLVIGVDAVGTPLAQDSLFPVASITKLATALAVLRLRDDGALRLDDPIVRYLPEAAAAQPGVTVRKLLCHTAGLPTDVSANLAPYTARLSWPILARACLETELSHRPATLVLYSNVGYGLLGEIVERQMGQPFAQALRELVMDPLEVEAYLGVPHRPTARVADVRSSHHGTDLEPYNSDFWLSLALPYGGLVTTMEGALALVQAFNGKAEEFLRTTTLLEATRNQAGELAGRSGLLQWPFCPWGLGPELRDAKTPHWSPPEASAESFGHAGASGCLAWCDSSAGVAWAFHGARVADTGWLLRRGAAIGAAILKRVGEESRQN
ncbi:MAG: beta-lactamase family protein [Anaerolineae bacterium]|nr:beta-lactamase family protein [Anaerolineae bacterium]